MLRNSLLVSYLAASFLLACGPAFGAGSTSPRPPGSSVTIPVRGIVFSSEAGSSEAVSSEAAGPLAGARVHLEPVLSGFELLRDLLEGRTETPPAATATSGADGRFTLVAPASGLWRLRVHAPGHVDLRAFTVPLLRETELEPVVLPRDVGARLRVVDAEGLPVAGAGVWIGSASRDLWQPLSAGTWRAAPRGGRTDAEGRLAVPRLAGEELKVEVWSPAGDAVARARMIDEATVTLPPPGPRRTIEVRGADGGPLAGVLVALGARAWPQGLTGDDGRRTLPAGDGDMPVMLFHPDGRHHAARLLPESPEPVPLTLPPAEPVRGRLLDAAGRGVGGALVWIAHHVSGFALTSAEGAFELRPPPNRGIRLEARAEGFLPAALAVESEGPVTLTLEPAAELVGRVVDDRGRPLPGARVETRRPEAGFQTAERVESWSVAGELGDFRLSGLTPETVYRVSAMSDGFATGEVEARTTAAEARTTAAEAVAAAQAEGLSIVLHPGRAAYGLVLDLDERPLAGVEVRLRPAGERPGASGEETPEADPFAAVTDGQGRFETGDVPAPVLDVTARGPGLAPLTVRGLELPPGRRSVDLGTFLLEPGARLEGRVLDPEGRPLAGARIWSAPSHERPRGAAADRSAEPAAASDADGRFAVGDLAPGRAVDLLVDRDGFLPGTVPAVEAPTPRPVTVVLRPAATLAGRVVDRGGRGLEGATVRVRSVEPADPEAPRPFESPSATADASGDFVLADVEPGRLGVDAFAEGFQPSAERWLELVAGEELGDVVFVLEEGAVLEGRVSDAGGDAVPGARVLVGRHGATTGSEGDYRVAGIRPGERRVEVRHASYNLLERDLEIELGGQRADFELTGGHPVAGRVTDASGLPLAGAGLELEGVLEPSLEPRSYRAESDAGGVFRWPGVAGGRYRLAARKAGYVTARLEDEIEVAGAVEDLEVRLDSGATITGRVLGLSFEELARVTVEARGDGGRLTATVSYEGDYRMIDAGPGDWLLIARLPGGGRQVQARVTLEEGRGRLERDLEFGNGLTLSGTVSYGDGPLAGAALSLDGSDVAVERSVKTDAGGRFHVADLPPGRYRLGVSEPKLLLVHNQDLALDADRDVSIEIRTARIVGEVRAAASGEPLPDALLLLKQVIDAAGSEGSLFTVASDAEGRFLLERLTSGRYRLTVRRDGYRPLTRRLDVPASGTVDLPLALDPAPGLDVMARLASGRAPRLLTLVALDAGGRPVLRASRVLDAEGYARFPSFPDGAWELLASSPGSALLRTRVEVPGEPLVAILPDAGALHVRLPELVESDAVATLRVLGAGGRPFERLDVSGELEQSWTVVGGRTTVAGLPAGAWTLVAVADDGRSWTDAVVTTGGPGVEVELGR